MLGVLVDDAEGDLERRGGLDGEVAVAYPAGDLPGQHALEALGVDVEVVDERHGVPEAHRTGLHRLADLVDAAVEAGVD